MKYNLKSNQSILVLKPLIAVLGSIILYPFQKVGSYWVKFTGSIVVSSLKVSNYNFEIGVVLKTTI